MSFTADIQEIVLANENGLLSAHTSWERVQLGLVATIQNGYPFESTKFSKESGVPLLRIRDILNTYTETLYSGEIPEGYWINRGDIVIGMDGDFNAARWKGQPALLNQRVCKIKVNTKLFDERFLYFLLGGYLKAINVHTSSVTVKHLSSRTISEIPLPLPPLEEQKRIADKLERLLARVDKGLESLARVPEILKRFRQAVLAAATSGELTAEVRGDSGSSWKLLTLGQVGDVSGGLTKNSKRETLSLRRPYLRVANVYANRLELADVSEIGLTDAEFIKTKLEPGDVLIVEGNGSLDQIGRAALWSGEIEDCVHQNHLIRWRSGKTVLPKFALFWLLSPTGRESLVEVARSTTGLHTLSISKVSAISIEVPSIEEQAEVVRRVESLFALADSLEARYKAALEQYERLTPAILAKAFRGELVPQDPSDEPASVLLERIKSFKENKSTVADYKPTAGKKGRTMKSKTVETLAELTEVLDRLGGKAAPEHLLNEAVLGNDIDHFYELLREGRNSGVLEVPVGRDGLIRRIADANQ